MTASKNFIGLSQFVHFYGVVEDRMDPLKTGRVRVRCLGFHTKDKVLLPTEDLPWAQVLLPITSSGISGVGTTPLGLVEGSWVVGYFRDSAEAQEPIVLGSLPGRPSEVADTKLGFYDPNGNFPRYKDEPDVNRLAVNSDNTKEYVQVHTTDHEEDPAHEDHTPPQSVKLRIDTRITGVATGGMETFSNSKGEDVEGSPQGTFDQPSIAYGAMYPFNHVFESESGHIREYDDTVDTTSPTALATDAKRIDYRRIYESHTSGTSYEFNPDGGRVDIIKASYTRLTNANEDVSIGGYKNVTLDGKYKLFINKSKTEDNHYDIQVGEGANINIQVDKGKLNIITKTGDMNLNCGNDFNLKVGKDYTLTVEGDMKETVSGRRDSLTSGPWKLTGSRIDLNP